MEPSKSAFKLGITFDDVLLLPGYSDFSRSDITLDTFLTKNIKLSIPLVSAPMDTVTEAKLAIALAKLGGIGIIHRNLTIANQAMEVSKVKKIRSASFGSAQDKSSGQVLLVGAAVGTSEGYEDRVEALIKAGVDVIVLDSAHGHTSFMISAIRYIKKKYPKVDVMAGNIATFEAAKALIEAGADSLRVGMGPGAICTTRIISGMGVPQITAIKETVRAAKKNKVPVIADGGIKYSGDMIKALAAGASACMMGSFFASCEEAPGQIKKLTAQQVPSRFKSILSKNLKRYEFKEYRAMGSIGAMREGARIKSEDEFHGKSYKDRVMVAEGVESLVPLKGTIKEVVDQALGGMRSGLYYVGVKSIPQLQKKAQFIKITQASLAESHPHDVFITNPGENYAH